MKNERNSRLLDPSSKRGSIEPTRSKELVASETALDCSSVCCSIERFGLCQIRSFLFLRSVFVGFKAICLKAFNMSWDYIRGLRRPLGLMREPNTKS